VLKLSETKSLSWFSTGVHIVLVEIGHSYFLNYPQEGGILEVLVIFVISLVYTFNKSPPTNKETTVRM